MKTEVFSLSLAFLLLTGCAATCPVVNLVADVAKQACPTVVEYLGEDGKVHRVQVSRQEMKAVATKSAKKAGLPAAK
jgi:hypothetical protein